MNAGSIWWNQIGSSMRLLDAISGAMEARCPVLLKVPQSFPWRSTFYDAVDYRRADFCAERLLKRIRWDGREEPGALLMGLDDLCPDQVRRDYWPGRNRAEYLGAQSEIFLNEHYVWITGIRDAEGLNRWVEFVELYEQAAADRSRRAVFILESTADPGRSTGLQQIVYRTEAYDCRVFALEAAAALNNTDMKAYQAELANSLSNGTPELCWAFLNQGERLLLHPVETAVKISSSGRASDGTDFEPLNAQQAHSAAWEAAAVLLFPRLERWRMNFIESHAEILRYSLPIRNSNGQKVTDPRDLEIGSLWYVVNNSGPRFSPEEAQQNRLCRDVRNQIAHNQLVSCAQIRAILEL